MTVSDYLRLTGVSVLALAKAAAVPYPRLRAHAANGKDLSVDQAKALEAATLGAIRAAEVLGIDLPEPPKPRGRPRKKAEAPPADDARQLEIPGA